MPTQPFAQQMKLLALWQEACFVASLRTALLAAEAWSPTAWGNREISRMWTEKLDAARAGTFAAALNPLDPWSAGLRPYSSRVRRNRKRLTRRATRH